MNTTNNIFWIFIFLGVILVSGCSLLDSDEKSSSSPLSLPRACSGEQCEDDSRGEEGDFFDIGPDASLEITPNDKENLPLVQEMETVRIFDGEEYEITAGYVQQEIEGKVYKRVAYNGQIPGPVLRVARGSTITLSFTNALDIPTTFSVPTESIIPSEKNDTALQIVAPGETTLFTIRFLAEGIHSYSSLVRRDYAQEMGLFGLIQVVPLPTEEYWSEVNQEKFLVFDDFLPEAPFSSEKSDYVLLGRTGSVRYINNKSDFTLEVKQGDIFRFYLANATSGRFLNISFGEKTKMVAGEHGLIEKEYLLNEIPLSPGERKVVEVFFSTPGVVPLLDGQTRIGAMLVSEKKLGIPDDIEQMNSEDLIPLSDFGNLRKNGSAYGFLRSQNEIFQKQTPEKELRIESEINEENLMEKFENNTSEEGGEDAEGLLNTSADTTNIYWGMRDAKTRKKGTEIDWVFSSGDVVKIRIDNSTDFDYLVDHVLHVDGQRFLVLSRDEKPQSPWQWQDTVKISKGEIVDILMVMDAPGIGVIRSQIPEHQHAGMMMFFEVQE